MFRQRAQKMNFPFSKYLFFEKERVKPEEIGAKICDFDRFISGFNLSPRVQTVFQEAVALEKHWLVFPEYKLEPASHPRNGTITTFVSDQEDEAILNYFERWPVQRDEKICVDSTGFIRPHLMFLLRYLYEQGCASVDFIYSEPHAYQKGESTSFATNLTEVRPVRCFEGSHSPEPTGEFLIVGCGYDTRSMSAVATQHRHATKVQMFPFPALRPHMYQENRIRTADCGTSFENVLETCFAPGYDPYATADVLSRFVGKHRATIKNLYLSPLATKPQVMGFVWFYLMECLNEAVTVVFPFSDGYNQETSVGLSEIWRYKMDFDLLRRFQRVPLGETKDRTPH